MSGKRTSIVVMMGIVALAQGRAEAAHIYMLSSGDHATDTAAAAALTLRGHSVVLGVQYMDFSGAQNLSGFDTVYLQANGNWNVGVMPVAGQQALVDWVAAGGRLVTSEWVTYYTSPPSKFGVIGTIAPLMQSFDYGIATSTTYEMVTPDPAINAGVPASLTFPLVDYVGTETFTSAKPGATVYYLTTTSPGAVGLAGWAHGVGMVFSFSSTCGPDQVDDPDFGTLFANVMGPVAGQCYANCDGSSVPPVLNVDDFTCFINEFSAAQSLPHEQQLVHYANCDASTVAPVLNVDDFTCFINVYSVGCR